MTLMNHQRHMALACGLLLSIAAAFAGGLWIPWMDKVEQTQARIVSLEERIAKLRALASRQAELKDALQVMQQFDEADNTGQFIVARSPTLGAADLQRRMQGIITANDARQVRSQPLSGADVGDFHKLEVTVNLYGSLRAIREILFAIEYGQPRIFVEQLLLTGKSARRSRGSQIQRRRRSQITGAQTGIEISARLSVSAYMQHKEQANARPTDG